MTMIQMQGVIALFGAFALGAFITWSVYDSREISRKFRNKLDAIAGCMERQDKRIRELEAEKAKLERQLLVEVPEMQRQIAELEASRPQQQGVLSQLLAVQREGEKL